jgi:hypothetical protein
MTNGIQRVLRRRRPRGALTTKHTITKLPAPNAGKFQKGFPTLQI